MDMDIVGETDSADGAFRQIEEIRPDVAVVDISLNDAHGLDLVQNAMYAFVRRYRDRPADQRRPIFYRCLNNRILDWHRKRTRRGRWMRALWPSGDDCADGPDAAAEGPIAERPDRALGDSQFARALDESLRKLPLRQRQVFLLRAWEGLDVAQTANALGISGGSVKTHYFRALGALRSALEIFDD